MSHEVWSSVYLDYTTEQGDIITPAGRPIDLHMDFEKEAVYEVRAVHVEVTILSFIFF